MNFKVVLQNLLRRFSEAGVEAVLSGGMALSTMGVFRYAVDAPDIQRLLKLHGDRLDMGLVREYFDLFGKEALLDEWLRDVD